MVDENIFLADKPKGITSFDVIRILRKRLGIKKMGHAGTLDPLASGLLIVGMNGGTKKMSEFLKLPKTYVAEILFGKRTSTGDMEGEVLESADASSLTEDAIKEALKNFSGTHRLAVPFYSAVKTGGVPLYKLARENKKNVVLPVKEMEVSDARFLSFFGGEKTALLQVEFDVSSGTYIRSLAEELGRRLNLPATLANLRRTRIGDFYVENAVRIEPLEKL